MQINGGEGAKAVYIQGDRSITWEIFRKAFFNH
jgi:hypothetical protein